MKYPYFQFYTGDWKKSTEVSMSSLAARGLWIELLIAMHENNRSGEISGTPAQLARLTGCDTDEFLKLIDELKSNKVALVTNCNNIVTVTNRRMKREFDERVSGRERVQKHRNKTKEDSVCNSIGNENVPRARAEIDIDIYNINNINNSNYKLLIELSKNFHEHQHNKYPNLLKKVSDGLIKSGADELDKLMRIDKYDIETIQKVLEFVKNDDRPGFNWGRNLLSLSSIRHKSKSNQNMKFVNILAGITDKHAKKSYSQIEVQNLTREGRYTWEDFKWDAAIKAYVLKNTEQYA
jgi:hypothetical protein